MQLEQRRQAMPHYIFIFNLTPGFNRLHTENCKTRRETFKVFLYLGRHVLENWR